MNMLKKGPDLKLSDIKVPDFLLDVYYDLKERHLLPVVAILIVAMVAVPIVIGRGSGEEPEEAPVAVASAGASASQSGVLVAKAAPGLRDYRKRLDEKTATNPFKPLYGSGSGEGEGSGSSESGASSAPIEPGGSETGGTTGGGETASSPGEEPATGRLEYFSFAIDVRVTPVSSGKDKPDPTVRRDLPELTMLPSRKVPALTFIGVTKDQKNAVMLVSDKVTGLFGDATCAVGSEACQLIVLEPGIPETVVYGANSRTWRIELIEAHLLKTDKLNTAPLGNSKGKGSKGGSGKHRGDSHTLQASVHAQEG